MTVPTIGELFAGYGGLGLGIKGIWPEAKTIWVSDVCKVNKDGPVGHHEPHRAPCSILAKRLPDAPNLGDIAQIDWATTERPDIIAGGFPCQDVSHAGKRAGMNDTTRSGLWSKMRDAIDALRPALVVAENVRGLLSAEASSDLEPCSWCMGDAGDGEPPMRALGAVLADLADIGYDAAWYGLRAADIGAPHGRWRVFVLAWPAADSESHRRVEGWAESAGLVRRPHASERGHADVALLPTPVVNDMGAGKEVEAWDEWTARLKESHGNGNGHGASLSIETLRLLKTPTAQLAVNGGSQHPDKRTAGGHGPTLADEVEHLLPTPKARDWKGLGPADYERHEPPLTAAVTLMPTPRATRGGSGAETMYGLGAERVDDGRPQGQVVIEAPDFGDYNAAVERWSHVIGRPAPSPTEPTGKSGAHRLSPRFVEWMMGLPDGWVVDAGATRNEELKALGNGVVPQQATAALRRLLDARERVAT